MDPLTERLLDKDFLLPVVIFGGGIIITIVTIVSSAIRAVMVSRAREQTKRELAAYVAEGTLDPDKALAMIDAGRKQ